MSMLLLVLKLQLLLLLVNQLHGLHPNNRKWKRQACSATQFLCKSGECIDKFLLCDGEKHCKDGSDETKEVCKIISCPEYAFKCDYGACVDASAKCDGVNQCADNSDEKDCSKVSSNTCKGNQFKCNSGICIDPFLLCDGTDDCDDGSDETSDVCRDFTCPEYAFRCDYGACIDKDGVCNGVNQCADRSDEKPEMCSTKTTPPPTPTTSRAPPPKTDGCQLPPQPQNGNYQVAGCEPPCNLSPGDRVDKTFITYSCNPGFNLYGSKFILCDSGWSSTFPTCSRVACQPLVSASRDIECKFNEQKVDCTNPMAPGTKSSLKCKPFYTHSPEFLNYDVVCNSEGKWSPEVTTCTPICGEPNPDGVPFIANGVQAKLGEFPWHAGIYRPIDGVMRQTCGGSIISERLIVTASHCFWDDNLSTKIDEKDFQIVVGKYFLDWNNRTRHVQVLQIDKVHLQDQFKGNARLYANDIAIIVLKTPLVINVAVRPICVDFNNAFINFFTPGKKGIVVGWGITETMKQKDTLHTATLPYVDFEVCYEAVPQSFHSYLTNDKFCAGYQNGTSVCPGDSGGGYATKFRDGKWYLMGIVSVGVPSTNADDCNIMQYTTFTKVFDYYSFIRQYKTNS